jgi:hypothetical protein
MTGKAASVFRKPRNDDRRPYDILFGVWGLPAVFVAHELRLFTLLEEKPRTLEEVCDVKNLKRRPAEALLSVATSLGIVRFRNGSYSLTPLGEDYFVESGPTYFGGLLDLTISNYSAWSIESLKKAVMTDSPQIYSGSDVFKSHEEEANLARAFTRAVHSASMAAATVWPEKINLGKHRVMLDVGGGSGAHSLGAVRRWRNLQATVFDLAPVCEVAAEIAGKYELQTRIGTQIGDMWNDSFPSADVHFYSMIFHDWPSDKCQFLAKKSFDHLDHGGRIIVHEMLFNNDRTGPFPVAALNIDMLVWVPGQQYSGRELTSMLREADFKDIQVKRTMGYWSIVTGVKR